MTVLALEFFNPNIYYSLSIDSSDIGRNPLIPSKYLSRFEELCQLGKLDSITELSIDKHYIKSESTFFNGLLISIQGKNRELFQYLIGLENYKNIMALPEFRWYVHI